MPEGLPAHFQKDFSSGMITNVNDNLIPENSVKLGLNVDFDEELGSAVTRLGTSIIGVQMSNNYSCLGLHDFRDSVGSGHKLFAVFSDGTNNDIYDATAGSATKSLQDDTKALKTRFLTYLDECVRVNGTDAVKAWNGSSWITTGGAFDLGNWPATTNLVIEFLDRVYTAGDSTEPHRVYYSGVAASGAVSWTSGNGSVDIEPEDGGGALTAFAKVPGYILFFKERSMKRWNFSSAFPESLVNIGTPSQEAVVQGNGMVGFFSASSQRSRGFYLTNGGRPVPISHLRAKNIKKWVDAIPVANESAINGWGTETHFYWSIGNVTVDSVAYTNVVVRWNIQTGEWSVRSYPNRLTAWSGYVDGSGNNTIVAGDSDGYVVQIDKPSTYTDNPSATPITWKIHTQDQDWGFNQLKDVSERVVINSRDMEGARVAVRIDGNKIHPIGDITGDVTEIRIPRVLRGQRFEFYIEGNQTGGRATLKEIEVPKITVLNNYK